MDVLTKIELALKPPTQEVVTREELQELFETNEKPRHYIGYEVSGKIHLGIISSMFKINDLKKAGVQTQVLLADWHSLINNKLGGDWNKIQKAAKYFEEAFKFFCPGTKVILGSDVYHNNDDYWKKVILFSKQITLARDVRCLTIMGRTEKEQLDLSQYFYPPMQAVDIHELGVDIVQAGMDQRKVHMLAREVFPKLGWKNPVSIHCKLIPGLEKPIKLSEDDERISSKMSKSKPDTCIYIQDSKEEIIRKISKAYCPPTAEENPVLEIAREIIFHEKETLLIEREQKYGGNIEFESYEKLEQTYVAGKLHMQDLKKAVAIALNEILEPIRNHFEKKKELLTAFE